jgi:hypothetical protein
MMDHDAILFLIVNVHQDQHQDALNYQQVMKQDFLIDLQVHRIKILNPKIKEQKSKIIYIRIQNNVKLKKNKDSDR